MKKFAVVSIAILIGIFAFAQQKSAGTHGATKPAAKTEKAPAMDKDTLVVFETDLGKIVFEFFPDKAPNHVKNFTLWTRLPILSVLSISPT